MSALLFPLPERPSDVVLATLSDLIAEDNPNDDAHAKQERRRFLAEPEPLTGFGDDL